ncbi:hypothetical protein BACCOP_03953, partial [Phocaeicola coprocola DSM 17136]
MTVVIRKYEKNVADLSSYSLFNVPPCIFSFFYSPPQNEKKPSYISADRKQKKIKAWKKKYIHEAHFLG